LADALATALVVAGHPGLQIEELMGMKDWPSGAMAPGDGQRHFPFASPSPAPPRTTVFIGWDCPRGMCASRRESRERSSSYRQAPLLQFDRDVVYRRALMAQDHSPRRPRRLVATSRADPPDHRADFPRSPLAGWEAAATRQRPEPLPEGVPAPEATGDGVEANARLTGMTAVVLLILLLVEGLTILRIGKLLTLHVVIGMVLVPPVVLKIGSTTWRFARYYLGSPEYRRKGPPPALLRLLGPFVVVLTIAVLGTGIALLIGPSNIRHELLFLHKATFILWIAAMTIHVLGHIADTARLAPRDFYHRSRRQIRGAGARQWALVGSLCLGVLLAIAIAPKIGPWRNGGAPAPIIQPAHIVQSPK
jgi:hypothetical protein